MKQIRGRLVPKILSLAVAGIEPATIAGLCRCDPDELATFLGRPDRRRPGRPIRGVLAAKVRRLAGDGRSAGQIAAELLLDPPAVADLLGRLDAPRPPRPGRYRPRPRRSGEWDDDDGQVVAPARPGAAARPPMPAQSHGPVAAVAAVAADWGPYQESWARGERCGAAKLSDDDARRVRTRRAEGLTLRELGEYFGVSTATVKRLLRGDTYRDAMPSAAAEADDLVVVELPATSPVPEPQGERWDGPPLRSPATGRFIPQGDD